MLFRVLTLSLIVIAIGRTGAAQNSDSVELRVPDGMLRGTLTVPQKAGKLPLLLILSDAGGADRDGNTGMAVNNVLRALSDSLARFGIASLRYDKRGIGRSAAATNESRLRFTDYAMDAIAWGKWLRQQKRWSKIIIAGHGEGALVGALAANDAGVDGFVSLLGPSEPTDTMVMRQVLAQGLKPGPADTLRALFAELRTKGSIARVPPGPFYVNFFRPSVQQYLFSWMQYDPITVYRNLKAPAAFIAGSRDLQQDSTQFERLRKALPEATHLMIPGMNRVLRNAPADPQANLETYYDAKLPLDSGLIPPLVEFVLRKR